MSGMPLPVDVVELDPGHITHTNLLHQFYNDWEGYSPLDFNGKVFLDLVLDYGCVLGSTSGTIMTANTVAINAALADSAAIPGVCIYFPGMIHVNGNLLGDAGSNADGLWLLGKNKESGIYDSRTGAVTTLRVVATGANQSRQVNIRNMKFDGAAGGANDRTAIEFDEVSKFHMEWVDFWATKYAIRGTNWWDGVLFNCRFDQCGESADPSKGVVQMNAPGAGIDCNSIRFIACTWEQCHSRLVEAVGTGKRNNKIVFDACKFETTSGFARYNQILVDLAHAVVFKNNHFSIGVRDSGASVFDVLDIRNTIYAVVDGNSFDGQPVGSGQNSVRTFMKFTDVEHLVNVFNGFESSSNHDVTVAAYEYAGSCTKVVDFGNDWGYIASGNPLTLRTGTPTNLVANPIFTQSIDGGTTAIKGSIGIVYAAATAGNTVATLPAAANAKYPITFKRYDDSAYYVEIDSGTNFDLGPQKIRLYRKGDQVTVEPWTYGWLVRHKIKAPYSRTVTGTTDTLTPKDDFVRANHTANCTLSIQAASNFDDGHELTIKRRQATEDLTDTLTIDTVDSATIDGFNSITLDEQHDSVTLRLVSSNWEIV